MSFLCICQIVLGGIASYDFLFGCGTFKLKLLCSVGLLSHYNRENASSCVIEQDGIFAKELRDQSVEKRLIFMHQVIIEGEGDIKIAREEIFSCNIDIENVLGGPLALFSDLFLLLKCSDLGHKLVYTYFRFYKGPPLKKKSHFPRISVHVKIF